MIPLPSLVERCSQSLGDLLLPPSCLRCDRPLETGEAIQICIACQSDLSPPNQFACAKCGARISYQLMNSESCPNCSRLSLPFASVTSLGNYEKSMRELVIEMKRPGREALGIQLGQWLGREISTQTWLGKLDMVTPVPIHWTRMLRRGYHVADLLVEGIQRRIDGLRKDRLIRYVRRTKKQGRLTTRQRFDNVRRCFAAVDPARLREKRILVVDDVMTSGATAIQAATSLLRCGAEQVHLAIVARGVGRR